MKKRSLAMLCVMVMLVTIALPLTALASSVKYVYTSNGKSLNMRSAPISHANNKIASVPYGAKVTVDSYVNSKTWAYVNYSGKWGYVMTRYLVAKKPADQPVRHTASTTTASTSNKSEYNGFVTTSYTAIVRSSAPGGFVNLRWAPSKTEAIATRMIDGQKLEVIAQNNSWAQVRVPDTGMVGFIMRAFLTETSGADS